MSTGDKKFQLMVQDNIELIQTYRTTICLNKYGYSKNEKNQE